MKKNSKLILSSILFALTFASHQIQSAQKMDTKHESAQPNAPRKTAMISAPDIKELEKWDDKFQGKYNSHKRWCFKCEKPKTIGDMNFSGDCLEAQTLKSRLEEIEKARRVWGQSPQLDLHTLGEFEIQTKGKWIDGVGYNLVLNWDEEQGKYLIVKRV